MPTCNVGVLLVLPVLCGQPRAGHSLEVLGFRRFGIGPPLLLELVPFGDNGDLRGGKYYSASGEMLRPL